MPLHIGKWERRDSADRDAFARAALTSCRATKAQDGIRSSRFYWANADTVAIVTDAEPGAFGPGSARQPSSDEAKALFELSDLAHPVSFESLGEAKAGEDAYRAAGR